MTKPILTWSPSGVRLSVPLGLARPQPHAPQPAAPIAPATPPAMTSVLAPTVPIATPPPSVPRDEFQDRVIEAVARAVVATPPTAEALQHGPVAMPAPEPTTRISRFAMPIPLEATGLFARLLAPRSTPTIAAPSEADTRVTQLFTSYDMIRDRLKPTVARPGDTVMLPPETICMLREPLVRVNSHMLAAKITDGHQGTIETPFAVGMTSRAVRMYATNEDAIGYALLLPREKQLAPVEVFILADGAGGHGHGDAASTAVVDEVLAALAEYNGERVKEGGERKAVEYLVAQGIDAADARIKAMPADPAHDNQKPCSTVQVIVVQASPNGRRVQGSFTWKGDSVGFRFDGHGTVRRQWGGESAFTVPHAPGLSPTASESEWLNSATNVIAAAVGLGERDPSTMSFSIGDTGGWFGSACDGVLGDNFGIGDMRAAVRGDTFEDTAHAALVILQGLANAERAKRKIRATLGTGWGWLKDRLKKLHPVKHDNRSLWIGVVPTPAEQARRVNAAVQVVNARLLTPGTNESPANGRHATRILMAAALLRDAKTQDLASQVLGQ